MAQVFLVGIPDGAEKPGLLRLELQAACGDIRVGAIDLVQDEEQNSVGCAVVSLESLEDAKKVAAAMSNATSNLLQFCSAIVRSESSVPAGKDPSKPSLFFSRKKLS